MGVEPYLVAASLSCVVSQRLVRTLCPYCSQEDARSRPLLQKLGCQDDVLDQATLRRPVGCDECRDSGYLGRTRRVRGDADHRADAAARAGSAPARRSCKRLAVAEGMETMRSAALNRALAGETSLEEVLRAIA